MSAPDLLQTLSSISMATQPRLWVRRLVIYESLVHGNSPVVIRDIPLQRGLNVIYGTDSAASAENPSPGISGHSVGKTTFCRLLRYILGEQRCGTKRTQERLQARFSYGYVGAEVLLDGQLWSVLRPFNPDRVHYIHDSIDLEALITERQSTLSVSQWREYLGEQLTEGVGGYGTAELLTNRWLKLLAWCSRDQEAGFRELHFWRSGRSESESPAFAQPRQGPLRLIRGILGLFTEESEQLDAELSQISQELLRAEADAAEAKKEPEYWMRRQTAWMEDHISKGEIEAEVVDTFGLAGAFQALINSRNADVQKLIENRDAAQERVNQLGGRVKEAQGTLDRLRAGATVLDSVTAELQNFVATDDQDADALEKALWQFRGFCLPGAVRIADCPIVRTRQEAQQAEREAKARIIPIGHESEPIVTQDILNEREEASQQSRVSAEALHAQILEFEKKLGSAREELNTFSNDLLEAQLELRDIERRYNEFADAQRLTADPLTNRPLQSALRRLTDSNAEKISLTNRRHALLTEHKERMDRLSALYNALVAEVLSNNYQGVVTLTTDDLSFSIAEQSDISGEAVETLAVVLADVAAVLASTSGIAFHPRFLIHDSPREADLQQSIYSSYFQALLLLHEHFGGDQAAPFQYIVTTTTPPPPSLNKTVRLKLNAHPEEEKLLKSNYADPTSRDRFPGV